MQAVLSIMTQELAAPLQSRDKLYQLLPNLLHSLKQQKMNKVNIPPSTVSTIANAINAFATDGDVVLVGLKCLQQIMLLLPHATFLLQHEGSCRALLAVLLSPSVTSEAAAICLSLMTQLSATSAALMSLLDMGMLTSLMNILSLHHSITILVVAVLQLFIVSSKVPEGAVLLTGLDITQAIGRIMSLHQDSIPICDAALKCLRRLAKHPSCRQALVAAGTVQLLVDVAHQCASKQGWHKQVKRASRAVWLLCQDSLTALPTMEPCWPLRARNSPHLHLADAMGGDVQRLHDLFPELQAVLHSKGSLSVATGSGGQVNNCDACSEQGGVRLVAAGCQRLPLLELQMPLRPPSVDQLMQQIAGYKEPCQNDNTSMAVACMLKDFSRLQQPRNRIVNDCTRPPTPYLQKQQLLPSSDGLGSPAPSHPNGAQGGLMTHPLGNLQFSSAFESGNLRLATQVADIEYDLFLSNDRNSRSYNYNSAQWFYFAVYNGQPHVTYRFNLVNFNKPDSLYACCQQPLMCCGQPAAPQCHTPTQQTDSSDTAATGGAEVLSRDKGIAEAADGYNNNALGSVPASGFGDSSGNMCTAFQHKCPASSACCWQRVGSNICYYPSPYRGKPVHTGSKSTHSAVSGPSSSIERDRSSDSTGGTTPCLYKKDKARSTKKLVNKRSQTSSAVSAVTERSNCGNSFRRSTAESCPADVAVTASSCQSADTAQLSNTQHHAAAISESYGPGLYCLSFEVSFPCSGLYYICSCYPYTYSDLQQQLARLSLHSSKLLSCKTHAVRSLLCYTLAGQRCDLLTITDFYSSAAELATREYVVITARVHPGESCASWVMQGILKFLVSSDTVAERLRRYFVFKLMPMLNPDGVVVGNHRCSLAGIDLNRCWDKAVKDLHPTIYHARKLMEALAEPGRLALTIDIHGHSTKTDAFFYGCEPQLAKPPKVEQGSSHVKAAEPMGSYALSRSSTNSCYVPTGTANLCSTDQLCVMGRSHCGNSKLLCDKAETEKTMQLKEPGQGTELGKQTQLVCQGDYGGHTEPLTADVPRIGVPSEQENGVPPAADNDANSPPPGGCDKFVAACASLSPAASARLRVRMLPYLASQLHPAFSFDKCNFRVQKNKAGTARVVAARQLSVPGAYTLEVSLAGASALQSHFGVHDYLDMGKSLMVAISQLADSDDEALLAKMACSVRMGALPNHPDSGIQ